MTGFVLSWIIQLILCIPIQVSLSLSSNHLLTPSDSILTSLPTLQRDIALLIEDARLSQVRTFTPPSRLCCSPFFLLAFFLLPSLPPNFCQAYSVIQSMERSLSFYDRLPASNTDDSAKVEKHEAKSRKTSLDAAGDERINGREFAENLSSEQVKTLESLEYSIHSFSCTPSSPISRLCSVFLRSEMIHSFREKYQAVDELIRLFEAGHPSPSIHWQCSWSRWRMGSVPKVWKFWVHSRHAPLYLGIDELDSDGSWIRDLVCINWEWRAQLMFLSCHWSRWSLNSICTDLDLFF